MGCVGAADGYAEFQPQPSFFMSVWCVQLCTIPHVSRLTVACWKWEHSGIGGTGGLVPLPFVNARFSPCESLEEVVKLSLDLLGREVGTHATAFHLFEGVCGIQS